jgi:multidrug efflux pump subunit AcrB
MRLTALMLVAALPALTGCLRSAGTGPVVVVTTSRPRADAQTVAETIATPIEQQINGVESMVRLESESHGDGSYIARVIFRPSTNPDLVKVLVQNRVALAQKALPERAQVAVVVSPAQKAQNTVALAIVDRGNRGRDALRRLCEAVVKSISADGALAGVQVFPGPDAKRPDIQIDRKKCAKHGVSVSSLIETVEQATPDASVESLKALKIQAANGKTVPLGDLATIKLVDAPSAVYRVDLYPGMRITGSLPAGKPLRTVLDKCVTLAEAERKKQKHPEDYEVLTTISP